ncbi:PREDICTED: high-affinity choline transporter 1-like isoform X1 [Vollenhovia emeryi]|uniref:high-affinity choline transporter 1-like isoform X1 n=1 Tax=Vollenhovia emeryi TaxID=411798 RepID=UPI0005F3CC34|nr:PREDICTED: high-affinity choline transporter 1-like isoform X1 [Vollenhovia emeryi]XP_011862824.1 PREDICTED: high-affinity choline transporter 1-like isoform X1 [Vollenhovia emeryi]XP_011862825.1 PREDICTED: high-affinity choline transporter 1-like isoform X1 [Vollenhovia emeryi]
MGVYVTGVIGVIVFYIAVLAVGVWAAAFKRRQAAQGHLQDDMMLANRRLGPLLGVFTLIATWVGGAFVNGTAEAMYTKGLAWCQVPIGYSLSLIFGAMLFVRPMRKAEYVTMLDPFQERYGAGIGGLLFLPALCGDLFWCGAVLRALGSSLAVVAGVDPNISVCASALLAAIYTVFGGLYSVACTDALQLLCILLGLAIAAPFSMVHPAVSFQNNLSPKDWLGHVKNEDMGEWVDGMLLLVFGGIPWQGYFQRILSIKSTSVATTLSIVSMFGCLILAVPSALIGVVARATDWSLVPGFNRTFTTDDGSAALPMVLRYLTPQWVSFVGLGAISAAVMSSADSSILASSSMFTRNVYKLTIRPKASERELNWVLRISVIVVSILSTLVALTVSSVYYLSYLCSDLVYVVLFPQLLAVIHWPNMVDTYGCLAGYFIAIVLRLGGGERGLGIIPLIEYPFYDTRTRTQKFPFRTAVMIIALFTQLLTSFLARTLLGKGYFPQCCDVLSIYSPGKSKESSGVVQSSSGAALMDSSSKSTSGIDSCDGVGTCVYDDERTYGHEDTNDPCDGDAMLGSNHAELSRAKSVGMSVVQRGGHNQQGLRSAVPTPARHVSMASPVYTPIPNDREQTLAVRNLRSPVGPQILSPTRSIGIPATPIAPCAPSYAKVGCELGPSSEKQRNNDRISIVDRSNMEYNLNAQENPPASVGPRKSVKGVKLVGMEGGPLRRPSLQVSDDLHESSLL